MKSRKITPVIFALVIIVLILSACASVSAKPSEVISSPPSGSTYNEGDDVAIQSSSADPAGIVRVELNVDGAVVRNDTPPAPQTNYTPIQTWKATQGVHTIAVRAYNAAGAASDPAAISISVNAAAAAPTTAPIQAAPPPVVVQEPPTPVPSTPVTPTSSPTFAPAPAACTNNAAFVADVTVPDGTPWAPGQAFNKIWRVKNTGTCAWTTAYDFAYASGEAMATTKTIAVPATAPGATADLLVAMVAPTTPGAHSGRWKLRNPGDAPFGGAMTVIINVIDTSASASAQPAAQPAQPAAPPAPSAATGCTGSPTVGAITASPSNFASGGGDTTLSWDAVSNADSVEIDNGVGGVGTPGNRTVHVGSTTTFTLSAHCGSNTVTAQASVIVSTLTLQSVPPSVIQVVPPSAFQLVFKATGASVSKTCAPNNITTNFAGTITANGSGNVTYRWEDSNGSRGGTYSLTFSAAGTKSTISTYRSQAGSGTIYIHVLTPNDFQSAGKSYYPTCP